MIIARVNGGHDRRVIAQFYVRIVPALTMIPIMGIIDPRMGIIHAPNAIGEALYGRTRQAVLRLFFGQPDRRFLQKEVIQRIGLGSGAVQRELERLSRAELLVRTVEGRQTYFQANP
ncbi:MAG: hypothetical protein DMG38_01500, partial [Acidobacteria bacterium]